MSAALTADLAAAVNPPEMTVLPNGLTLLARRDRGAPAVAIVTHVRAGYFDEPDDLVGIAHVLEHMYFKGTPTRGVGEIARETKASGGYLNAHTIYDHTSYYTVVPAARFADALAIQADAYAQSSIDASELAKEIEVIIQEVRRKEDSPGAIATEGLYALLHDRHRMRRWRMGRPDALRGFTRDRVTGFHRTFYRPSNTILSVVGDVDPGDVRAAVERRYGSLPDGAVAREPGPAEPDAAPTPRYREWSGDIVQTQLLLGWRTPPTLHPDTPLLDLAALVLGAGRGSRLYRAVRERQLASTIAAANYTPTEVGVFLVHAEAPPPRAAEAAPAIWAQIEALQEVGVTDRELVRAQRLLESRWVRRLESMEGQASDLAEWQALGDWSLGVRYLERALSASPEEVSGALRRYLTRDAVGVVVYRPSGSPVLADTVPGLLAPPGATPPPPLDAPEPAPAAAPAIAPAAVRGRAPARLEAERGDVRVYRAPSGIPILVRRKPDARVTHAGVFAVGGARDEGVARGGLTSLTVRAALKGAAGRSSAQLAEAVEMLGGSIGASVSTESFGWTLSVPGRHTAAALALLGDVVQRPLLDAAAVNTERTLALVELENLRDDMYRYPVRLATEAAYDAHPYARSVLGTDASLRAITADDVRSWHAARVLDAPTVIGIVSGGDPDDVAAAAGRAFAELRPATLPALSPPIWPPSRRLRADTRDKAQTALALAFPAPGRLDDDRTVAELIAGVASGLGGRFFDELRDRRSLAYTVHAFAAERALGGTFIGYIATSPDKEDLARSGLLGEFEKLVHEGVTADELRRAQTYAIGTHAISRQSGATLLGEMVDAWSFGRGLEELEEYEARVRAVTLDDVRRVAGQYFDPARVVEGVVRGAVRDR